MSTGALVFRHGDDPVFLDSDGGQLNSGPHPVRIVTVAVMRAQLEHFEESGSKVLVLVAVDDKVAARVEGDGQVGQADQAVNYLGEGFL